MPKADLGGIKFKTSKKKSATVEKTDSDEGSFEGSNDSDEEKQGDEEKVESPDISLVMKDSSFINNTIVAAASLLNQPMSALSTVR